MTQTELLLSAKRRRNPSRRCSQPKDVNLIKASNKLSEIEQASSILTSQDMVSLIVQLLETKQFDNTKKQPSMRLTEIGAKVITLTEQAYDKAKFGPLKQFLTQTEYEDYFVVRNQRVLLSPRFDRSAFCHTSMAISLSDRHQHMKRVKRSLNNSLDQSMELANDRSRNKQSINPSPNKRRSWMWLIALLILAFVMYHYYQQQSRNAHMAKYLELLDKQASLLQLELETLRNSSNTG